MRRPCIRCRSVSAEADLCAQCMIKPRLYPRLIAPFPKIRRSNIRLKNGLIRFQRQGPAAAYTTLALNTTEVYSMELTSSIPRVYRFSIADPSNNIWLFDIRSLYHIWNETTGRNLINPYNRTLLSEKQVDAFCNRIKWLSIRHYDLAYNNQIARTPRQQFQQKIIDTFSRIEQLGYTCSTEWFENLDTNEYAQLYNQLFSLWIGQISPAAQRTILPHSNGNLFYFAEDIDTMELRTIDMMWRLVTEAESTEDRITGAIYCLIALSNVSEECAAAYEWLQEEMTIQELPSERGEIILRIEDSMGAFNTHIIHADMFHRLLHIPDSQPIGTNEIQQLIAMYPAVFGRGTPEYIIPVGGAVPRPEPLTVEDVSLEALLALPFDSWGEVSPHPPLLGPSDRTE